MTHDRRYTLASVFGVRSAGVAFDVLEQLGSPLVLQEARHVDDLARVVDAEARRAFEQLATMDPHARSKLEQKLAKRAEISPERIAANPWLDNYAAAIANHRRALAELEERIDRELTAKHAQLLREASRVLPDFFVIEASRLDHELQRLASHEVTARSQDRKEYRTLALYLQRVCAKNDTFSRFGPISWGRVVPGDGVVIRPHSKIAGRRVELETWVAARLAALINADPATRIEIAPRLHPHAHLASGSCQRLDEDREVTLSPTEYAIARRCDGQTPAHVFDDQATLERLVELGVILWTLEPYARDSTPFTSLLHDIAGWRDTAVCRSWQTRLAPLGVLVERFAKDSSPAGRRVILAELTSTLDELGVGERDRTRMLYAATNPINESCHLDGEFTIGAAAIDRLTDDAWPWFELWADSMALAADRIYTRIFEIVQASPRRNGALMYSGLARTARAQGFDIEGDVGQSEVANSVWKEIRREFSQLISTRDDAPVWQLTADECTFLRRRHDLPPPGEIALPSLDLLVMASSPEDAACGRFDWLIGESHMAFALLQHSLYWCCPDKPALHAALRATIEHRNIVARDAGNALPVHVNPEAFMEAVDATHVGRARPKPGLKVVAPAEAEVIVDEKRRDVRLRAPSGEDLGSIIRIPPIGMGMHPFFPLERAPHEPRLRLGSVVVQRQSWHVASQDLAPDRVPGVSAVFLTALERERANRGIPRWVYVRPPPAAMTGSYKERDKDNKPICIDLESLISLDIFERRLRKYEGLILTEMLPYPDQLVWKTPEGRFVFELRTNLIRR